MQWTLIFCDQYTEHVQAFIVNGDNPPALAKELEKEFPWIESSYYLIAAIKGTPGFMLKDDVRGHDYGLI